MLPKIREEGGKRGERGKRWERGGTRELELLQRGKSLQYTFQVEMQANLQGGECPKLTNIDEVTGYGWLGNSQWT